MGAVFIGAEPNLRVSVGESECESDRGTARTFEVKVDKSRVTTAPSLAKGASFQLTAYLPNFLTKQGSRSRGTARLLVG